MSTRTNRNTDEYRITVRPLSKDEGGGHLVEYPEIPGCMSDGETIEEAIANGREALRDCLDVFKESGRKAPPPRHRGCAMAPASTANALSETDGPGKERGRKHQQSRDGHDCRGDWFEAAGATARAVGPKLLTCTPESESPESQPCAPTAAGRNPSSTGGRPSFRDSPRG